MRRRWQFLKKLGHYYILQFDDAMFTPPQVRVEGLCSTTKIPEEIGEISFYYTTFCGPSAEHYYFSDGMLDSVYSYDGFLPTFLEQRLGAMPVRITNECIIEKADPRLSQHVSHLAEYFAHVKNRRAHKAADSTATRVTPPAEQENAPRVSVGDLGR